MPKTKDNHHSSQQPAYVVNIPIRVESDTGSTSEGTDDDGTFSDTYFKEPMKYFRLAPKESKKRGHVVESDDYTPENKKKKTIHRQLSKTLQIRQQLVEQFTKQSFGKSPAESEEIARDRIGIVFGLNKMRSLSRSRNKSLRRELNHPLRKAISIKQFGFFWDGVWEKLTINKDKKKWQPITYKKIRKFYRQLKKHDQKHAAIFRKQIEKHRGHMVPFREIRERIKNHQYTKDLVNRHRANKKERPIYLGIFDSDSQKLNPDGQGLFSHYDRMIERNQSKNGRALEVASTGYLFSRSLDTSKENPSVFVGVELDLETRVITAKFFKFGVYYPEPNFIVRVLPNKKTVEESFITAQKHYISPQESTRLLEKIIFSRKIDPQKTFAFIKKPILSTTPDRALIDFTDERLDNGLIVRWRERTINAMRKVSQSHFHPKKWVDNLLKDPQFKDKYKDEVHIVGEILKDKNIIRQMLISLISRVFSHYDAVSIAKNLMSKNESLFPRALIETLEQYEPNTISLMPVTRDRAVAKKDAQIEKIWQHLDSIDTLASLKERLTNFFTDPDLIDKVEQAAQEIGKVAVAKLKKHLSLNFVQLSLALLEDYYAYLENREPAETNPVHGSKWHMAVLENNLLNEDAGFKKEFNLKNMLIKERVDNYGASLLHLAALTGNKELIMKLIQAKKKFVWLADIHTPANHDVLPLHLALEYCFEHGNDIELLRLLLDEKTAQARVTDKKTPLVITLLKAEKPKPIMDLLFAHPVLPEKLKHLLISSIKDIDTDNDAAILMSLIHKNNSEDELRLIEELIKQGLDVNQSNDNSYPIFRAIETGNMQLIQKLLELGAKVNNGDGNFYNEAGKTIILAAMESFVEPFKVVKLLVEHDADVTAYCEHGCSAPIHIACEENLGELVEYFIGLVYVNLEVENSDGNTPLQVAIASENNDLINLLIKTGVVTCYLSCEETQYIRENTSCEVYNSEDEQNIAEDRFQAAVDGFHSIAGLSYNLKKAYPEMSKQEFKEFERFLEEEICDSLPSGLCEDLCELGVNYSSSNTSSESSDYNSSDNYSEEPESVSDVSIEPDDIPDKDDQLSDSSEEKAESMESLPTNNLANQAAHKVDYTADRFFKRVPSEQKMTQKNVGSVSRSEHKCLDGPKF